MTFVLRRSSITLVSFVFQAYTLFLQQQLTNCSCSIKKSIVKFVDTWFRTGRTETYRWFRDKLSKFYKLSEWSIKYHFASRLLYLYVIWLFILPNIVIIFHKDKDLRLEQEGFLIVSCIYVQYNTVIKKKWFRLTG